MVDRATVFGDVESRRTRLASRRRGPNVTVLWHCERRRFQKADESVAEQGAVSQGLADVVLVTEP